MISAAKGMKKGFNLSRPGFTIARPHPLFSGSPEFILNRKAFAVVLPYNYSNDQQFIL
jgi:hypothetical protein